MVQLMDKSLQNANALQNINGIDRSLRIALGAMLVGSWLVVDVSSVGFWFAVMPLIGAVAVLSGVIGWCPIHAAFGTKSCGLDSHNTCGTLPFQIHRLFKSHHHSV